MVFYPVREMITISAFQHIFRLYRDIFSAYNVQNKHVGTSKTAAKMQNDFKI